MLLRFKAVHIHRQLRRSHNIGEKDKFPASELSTIAKIEIFGEGIVLPASPSFDAGASPETSRPIEIKKAATAAARSLLEQEVPIEKDCLHACKQRIASIQMA